mgnify:CR=1 FL=1
MIGPAPSRALPEIASLFSKTTGAVVRALVTAYGGRLTAPPPETPTDMVQQQTLTASPPPRPPRANTVSGVYSSASRAETFSSDGSATNFL